MRRTSEHEGLQTSRPYHYTRNAQVQNAGPLSQRFVPDTYRSAPSEYVQRRIPQYQRALQYRDRRTRNQSYQFGVVQGRGNRTQRGSRPYSNTRQRRLQPGFKKQKAPRRTMDADEQGSSQEPPVQEQGSGTEQGNVEVVVDATTAEQSSKTPVKSKVVSSEKKSQKKSPKSGLKLKRDGQKAVSPDSEENDTGDAILNPGVVEAGDVDRKESNIDTETSAKELGVSTESCNSEQLLGNKTLCVILPHLNLEDLALQQENQETLESEDLALQQGNQQTLECEEPEEEEEDDFVLQISNSSSESYESMSPRKDASKESEKLATEKPSSDLNYNQSEENATEVLSFREDHSLGRSIRSVSSRRPLRSSHSLASPTLSWRSFHDFSSNTSRGVVDSPRHTAVQSSRDADDTCSASAEAALSVSSKKRKGKRADDDQELKKQKSFVSEIGDMPSQNSGFRSMVSSPFSLFKSSVRSEQEQVLCSSTPLQMCEQKKMKGDAEEKSLGLDGEINPHDILGKEIVSPIAADSSSQASGYKWCSIM